MHERNCGIRGNSDKMKNEEKEKKENKNK